MPRPKTPKKGQEAPDDAFKQTALSVNDPRTMVLALAAPELEVCTSACDSLQKFAKASTNNRLKLNEVGALEPVVKLLDSEHEDLRHLSSLCLATLTSEYDVRQALRASELQYLDPLQKLIEAPSVVGQENACTVWANMTTEYSSRVALLERGSVPLVVPLLSSASNDVQRAAAKTTLHLSDEYDARAQLVANNAFEPLLGMLGLEFPELQRLALGCIANGAKSSACRDSIRSLGGLEQLLALVGNAEAKTAHVASLTALAAMLRDPACMERLSQPPPVTGKEPQKPAPLVSLIEFVSEPEPTTQIAALNCVATAAVYESNRRIWFDSKGDEAVGSLLGSNDPKLATNMPVAKQACRTAAILAESVSNAEALSQAGAFPKLLKLVASEDAEAREQAATTLAALVQESANNRQALVDAGGLQPMVDALKSESVVLKTSAALAFLALAQTPKTAAAVQAVGVIGALSECLGSADATLVTNTCRALAVMSRDAESRLELLEAGAIPRLLKLAQSRLVDIRRPASRVISLCAGDTTTAAELCKLGAIEVLQNVASSIKHRSEFIVSAFSQLLDSNLSAKLAITGQLGFLDVVSSPFYDMGRIKTGASFPTLESLLAEEVDERRAIILVNGSQPAVPAEAPRPTSKSRLSSASGRGTSAGSRAASARKASAKAAAAAAVASAASALPVDDDLQQLIADTKAELDQCSSVKQKVQAIAATVCSRLGGTVDLDNVRSFSVHSALADLKADCNSNVVPLGKLRKGHYIHRAVLTKVLADQAGVPCMLVRGPTGWAYNVVRLADPVLWVLDTMHEPGTLEKINSIDVLLRPANFFASIEF